MQTASLVSDGKARVCASPAWKGPGGTFRALAIGMGRIYKISALFLWKWQAKV